jgi:GDP-D-mannose dehydratase
VREFVTLSAQKLGLTVTFEGSGVDEVGIISHIDSSRRELSSRCKVGDVIVRVTRATSARPKSRRCWATQRRHASNWAGPHASRSTNWCTK